MEYSDKGGKKSTPVKGVNKRGWARVVAKVKREFEESNAHKKEQGTADRAAGSTARATWWIAVFTIVLAGVGALTLWEIVQSGVDTSDLVDAARKQARAAYVFTQNAANINQGISDAVKRLDAQAKATQKAANIASQTLHVSQRAYISMPSPEIDFENHVVNISFWNKGHIPTGTITGAIHEATLPIRDGRQSLFGIVPDEKHWTSVNLDSIVQDSWVDIGVVMPKLVKDVYESGHQAFIITGYINYTDGFPNTPKITLPICWRSEMQLTMNRQTVRVCDQRLFLPELERLDGYPNNEQK